MSDESIFQVRVEFDGKEHRIAKKTKPVSYNSFSPDILEGPIKDAIELFQQAQMAGATTVKAYYDYDYISFTFTGEILETDEEAQKRGLRSLKAKAAAAKRKQAKIDKAAAALAAQSDEAREEIATLNKLREKYPNE